MVELKLRKGQCTLSSQITYDLLYLHSFPFLLFLSLFYFQPSFLLPQPIEFWALLWSSMEMPPSPWDFLRCLGKPPTLSSAPTFIPLQEVTGFWSCLYSLWSLVKKKKSHLIGPQDTCVVSNRIQLMLSPNSLPFTLTVIFRISALPEYFNTKTLFSKQTPFWLTSGEREI